MTDLDCCGAAQGIKCINDRCAAVAQPDMGGCVQGGGDCSSAPASCCGGLVCTAAGKCGIL
jgi:hypothetical protein